MGLFNSTVLDVATGLVFVYLLLSVFCTTVNEWISGVLQTRSKTLMKGITGLLDNQPFKEGTFLGAFYKHPVIVGTMQDGAHPSYLSSRAFAVALTDLVADFLIPRIAAAEFALVEPYFETEARQCIAERACGRAVIRGIAEKYRRRHVRARRAIARLRAT